MRIVYDNLGPDSRLPVKPIAPVRGIRETVTVVRVGRVWSGARAYRLMQEAREDLAMERFA